MTEVIMTPNEIDQLIAKNTAALHNLIRELQEFAVESIILFEDVAGECHQTMYLRERLAKLEQPR